MSSSMATAHMSPVALEQLQKHHIDLKDFTKARTRYTKIVQEGCSSSTGATTVPLDTDVTQLQEAWSEYVQSAQLYFNRVVREVLDDLLDPLTDGQENYSLANTQFGCTQTALASTGESIEDCVVRTAAPTLVTTEDRTLFSSTSVHLPTCSPDSAFHAHSLPGTPSQRAERMNDFCSMCEKWFFRNERIFDLAEPVRVARLAASAVASISRLLRLLGVRMVYLCAGSKAFMQAFFSIEEAVNWVGLFGDREIYTEVEALLSLIDRMISIADGETSEGGAVVPFGWLYRVRALLDPTDGTSNVPPKRKSQAMRVAVRLLQKSPDQATAAGIHTTLMRACVTPGGATTDEVCLIVKTILDLFDGPSTRRYMPFTDVGILYAPFLDTTTPSTPIHLATLNNAREAICMILSKWVGLVLFSAESTGLRSMIDVLHLPGDVDRKMVLLSLFNNLLALVAPHRGLVWMEAWRGLEEDRRRRSNAATADQAEGTLTEASLDTESSTTAYDNMIEMMNKMGTGGDNYVATTRAFGYHVMDTLLGHVLIALVHHGLPLALITMVQSAAGSRLLVETASNLLHNILVLMDTVLPMATVKPLHEEFNRAAGRFVTTGGLLVGGSTSQFFHSYKFTYVAESRLVMDGGKSAPAPVEATFSSPASALNMDSSTFATTLRETKVITNTNYRSWNYDLLLFLVRGPLRNTGRFCWTRDNTDFLHRLITFFKPVRDEPSVGNFCSLDQAEVTQPMCVLGVALVDLLLFSREGAQLLKHLGFPKDIAKMLKEVRSGRPTILTMDCINSLVGRSLLCMVGRFSSCANGLLLMHEHDLFEIVDSLFFAVSGDRVEQSAHDDSLCEVCHQLLQHLHLGAVPNYGVSDDIRQTFRAALGSSSKSLRLAATVQLTKAVWRDLSTSMKWGMEILLQALHDDYFSVVEAAFKLLFSVCFCSVEGLDYLISLYPTVLMESESIINHAKQLHLERLLYRIAERPSGFRFLQCYGWIDNELRIWEESESASYAKTLEALQYSGVQAYMSASCPATESSSSESNIATTRSYLDTLWKMYKELRYTPQHIFSILSTCDIHKVGLFPVHFAGVLCSTAEGCTLFKYSDLWNRSVRRILEQRLPPDIAYTDSRSDTSSSSSESDHSELVVEAETSHSTHSASVRMDHGADFALRSISESAGISDSPSAHKVTGAEIRSLKKGKLPGLPPSSIISAARGYRPQGQAFALETVGCQASLKDAILCLCAVGSSDVGYGMLRTVPKLLKHLAALARLASTITVRSIAILGRSILARSERASEDMAKDGYYIKHNQNAYVSTSGISFAVAIAHTKLLKCMCISRRHAENNTSVNHSLARHWAHDNYDAPRRIWENVFALANPVTRENAKKLLYKIMHTKPQLFTLTPIRQFCLAVTATYRMRQTERKFIADLLENAQLLLRSNSSAKAPLAATTE